VLLALRAGLGTFYKHSIFEPGEPQCANACGFFNGVGLGPRSHPTNGDQNRHADQGHHGRALSGYLAANLPFQLRVDLGIRRLPFGD
jgi:hypothetical protein